MEARLEELQVEDEGEIQHPGTNKYISVGFLHLQLIHILALSPQVTVYTAWVLAKHIQVWNQDSLGYGIMESGGADYTISPFPQHNYTGVVVQGFRSSCCYSRGLFGRVTQTSLVRILMHKLIAPSALALRWRHAVSCSTSIISLRLGSSASFQVPVTLVPTVQPFYPASLASLLSNSGYMNQHAMWKYCIAHKWSRMYIYMLNTHVPCIYIYIYIYIDNFPFSAQVWGSLRT